MSIHTEVRKATARYLTRTLHPPQNPHYPPITLTLYRDNANPLIHAIASITGPHRIIRMTITANQQFSAPNVWDILISDHNIIDANALLNDRRLSGNKSDTSGFFALTAPFTYNLNIPSSRPLTYYKLVLVTQNTAETLVMATLTAVRQ